MKYLMISLFFLSSFYSFAQFNPITNPEYYDTHKHYSSNGKIKKYNPVDSTWKPLGLKVMVIYNTFFKSYTVTYVDAKGAKQEMVFTNGDSSTENYVEYDGKKWRVETGLEDYFRVFSGWMIFRGPHDAADNEWTYQFDITFNMK